MKTAWLSTLCAGALALTSLPAAAQMVVSAKSGVVNFTEGNVLLNDQTVESSVTKYPEVKENSVLRTEAGRVEVLLTPGTVMRLGENASVKMISNRLVDTRLELTAGSSVVETVQTAKDNSVTVVVGKGAATLAKAGVYRFDTEPARLKVYHGEAAVEIDGQTVPISSGRTMLLDGSTLTVEKFNADDTDALDHWSKQRGQLLAMANPSTAKSFMSSGYAAYGTPGCAPYWGFNNWYGMYTYVPCRGYFRDPYGFSYWSPITVGGLYYRPVYRAPDYNAGSGFGSAAYSGTGANSSGYASGISSSSSSMGTSMGSSMGSSGSTAASSGGGSVGGHGGGGGSAGGGGGHGH